MTTQEMMKSSAAPGHWWVNVARLGESPNWQQQPMPSKEDGDPNSPAYRTTLFGYDQAAFLSKQYK
jgi:hypothetical protein